MPGTTITVLPHSKREKGKEKGKITDVGYYKGGVEVPLLSTITKGGFTKGLTKCTWTFCRKGKRKRGH